MFLTTVQQTHEERRKGSGKPVMGFGAQGIFSRLL